MAVAPGTIGVGTVRNMEVPVEVEVLESEPMEAFDAWDQVNECDLEIASGTIVIAGCTDYFPEAERIQVEPGSYRARLYYGKLDSLSEDGLDGDDHYRVVLWMSEPQGVRVLIPEQRAEQACRIEHQRRTSAERHRRNDGAPSCEPRITQGKANFQLAEWLLE